jgi:UDP-N-acetyl-alpha-D-muramoyl-L-alanyl-L-glutamate epimerase
VISQASPRPGVFRYEGFRVDPATRQVVCDYSVDGRAFREVLIFPSSAPADWDRPAATEAARLAYLLAGISYFKTTAPGTIDLGAVPVTAAERAFLLTYHLDGLGEFAYRNGIDLSGLRIVGPSREPARVGYEADSGRPLIPFGGGVDSITSVELIRDLAPDAALFVVNRPGDRFDAIELPAVVTGLPIVRAERVLDEQVLRSRELGFLNGHVPVTGILSAMAVLAAVLDGRDAVVMSNEWSASVGTIEVDGRSINHQYSKSLEFETGLRTLVFDAIGPLPDYFSLLRPYTELWIARRFAGLTDYFSTFRSCNRAFHIDRAARYDHWCGRCDKCCFIDLILAPFVDRPTLARIFDGKEPLEQPDLIDKFRILAGLSADAKPWECVGDVTVCAAAVLLAAERPDRAGNPVLAALARAIPARPSVDELMVPIGEHHIPARYDALLV